MTAREAISKARALKPNLYDDDILAGFLTELDGKIALEIMGRRAHHHHHHEKPNRKDQLLIYPEDGEEEPPEEKPERPAWPPDYSGVDTWDTPLLAKSPYDGIYPLYLVAMIDFHNRETESYANDMAVFNTALAEYRAWYRRTHGAKNSGAWRGY